MFLPDAKMVSPELMIGRRTGQRLAIDWCDPLAQSMIGCWVFCDLKNLATGATLIPSEPVNRIRTRRGEYIDFNASLYFDLSDKDQYDFTGIDRFTITAVGIWRSRAAHSSIFNKGDVQYALKHAATNELEAFVYDTTWRSVRTAMSDGEYFVASLVSDGESVALYKNGGLAGSSLHSGVASSIYDARICSNSQKSGREGVDDLAAVFVHRRALSPVAIRQLHANPYQFLIPA